ncbi:MAG TPA: AMP-binding protein, partial [Thermoanaerobaculia bacterium]|nr:AMP-binding protein [Thermoanaerobaculia bacterium]
DEALTAALKTLSQRNGATLFMTLLAGWQLLLSRYSGQTDVVVGAPIAGRTRPEVEGVVGFFANTLPLPVDLGGAPRFAELVGRLRGTVVAALEHADVPFDAVVEALAPERSLSHTPLFQVVFAVEERPARPELPGVTARARLLDRPPAQFELNLTLVPGDDGEGLAAHLVVAADRFRPETAERLLASYATLLAAAVAAPETPVDRLPLMPDEERRRLLALGRGAARPEAGRTAVHELVLAAAARRPEAPAVVWDGGAMSYGELVDRSAALARRLAARGVGLETRVGLALGRSPEMVVATLAVLRAGGAYLPLDPDYPAERLAHLLADGGARLVIADRASVAALPPGAPSVLFDEIAAALDPDPPPALPPVPADALAYVMYTSGSTGLPKGVAVTHRNVARLVAGADWAELSADETFLQAAPTSFDAATLEIWGALANGGRLALLPPGRRSVEEVAAAVERFGVTTLWLTAGLFHQAVDAALPALAGVRHLLAGGDVLSPAHVDRAVAALPRTAVIDGYGPTENSTFTCCHRARGGESPVPVGRPIAGTTAHVVDGFGEPVPVGVAGELVAGG